MEGMMNFGKVIECSELMKQEGMAGNIEVNLEDFHNKDFVTFRKTKNYSEIQYSTKYTFVNLVNKHFVQKQDALLNQVSIITFNLQINHQDKECVNIFRL